MGTQRAPHPRARPPDGSGPRAPSRAASARAGRAPSPRRRGSPPPRPRGCQVRSDPTALTCSTDALLAPGESTGHALTQGPGVFALRASQTQTRPDVARPPGGMAEALEPGQSEVSASLPHGERPVTKIKPQP